MSDRFATANIDIDPELMPGAHNAVSVCLQLTPEERVTIITDEATWDIAAALRAEVEEIGSEHAVFVLENYATRPHLVAVSPSLDWIAQAKPEVTNA